MSSGYGSHLGKTCSCFLFVKNPLSEDIILMSCSTMNALEVSYFALYIAMDDFQSQYSYGSIWVTLF